MAASVETREIEFTMSADQATTRTPARTKSAQAKKKTPVTVPKPFNFSLDRRIADRKTYQEGLEKKQREAEEREKIVRLEKEEEDKKELKEFRKSLNFKAKPIRKYREAEITPSNKDLTCPMAPTFATDARIMMRSGERASSNGGSISPHSSNSLISNSSTS